VLAAAETAGLLLGKFPKASIDFQSAARDADEEILDRLGRDLDPRLVHGRFANREQDVVVLPLGAQDVLVFPTPDCGILGTCISPTIALYNSLGVGTFIVLLLLYALRTITAPLSQFVAITKTFGRNGESEWKLPEQGSSEMAQLARALNDMRERVRTLVGSRTHMLRAISHDLRTPLTRLRLRAERSTDSELRDGMLRDVARIDEMIGETLAFLQEDALAEPEAKVDLPSLLQTTCADFTDIGHDVTYEGRARFSYPCRSSALSRAIANLVDNGVKFGTHVVVTLRIADEGAPVIEISDDGPGIAAGDRTAVLEPFFRADQARTGQLRSGFGLGLSIVQEVVRSHGGTLTLEDHLPHGLTTRITLPPRSADNRNIS
jgi:signal transduction histidine kinase